MQNSILNSKMFIIKRSLLARRMDPIYYNSDLNKFNSGKFESCQLKSVVLSFKSGVGAGKQDQAQNNSGYIQIRPTNISDEGELKFEKNIYLPIDTKIDSLEVGDIIFNNTNSQELVGKTAILREEKMLFFSNHITRIRVDRKKICPEYLWIVLNMYQQNKIFFSICTNWNNQSGIGLEVLKTLRIPIPPMSIQEKIVKSFLKVRTSVLEKKEESKRLLESIDSYFLQELGVQIPMKRNSLADRINSNVRLRDITGSRFDPMLYDHNTIELKKAITEVDPNRFLVQPLKSVIQHSAAGDWGVDEHDDIGSAENFVRCLVIRATEFDNDYNLKLDNSRVKYRLINAVKLQKIEIKENDLLIEKSGGSPDQPVGRISLIDEDILKEYPICYSNFIHKIRVDDSKLRADYLFCFLKTMYNIKLTEAMQSQTNGIRNLIMPTYLGQTIIIPINQNKEPDLTRQKQIADHIGNIRRRAKSLTEQARDQLSKIKNEIVEMITN